MANIPTNQQPYVYTGVYGLATKPEDLTDKEQGVKLYVTMALCRTQSMFTYLNLPDTIPQRSLELYIQTGGSCCVAKHGEELYAFFGTMGGEPNEYFMPTKYIVANPYLNFSKEYTIHENCVVIPNDAMYMGLMPIFRRYATQLVENDITMFVADINSRIASLLTGNTDRDVASAQEYIKKIHKGELGIALSTPFMEGIKAQPYGETNSKLLTDLIELQQYYKASMFNDIGLNSNYNMKRETIVSAEIELNADALFPFVDNMLYCRRLAVEEINKMFGTDIEVHLNSSWEQLKDDRKVTEIIEEAEALSAIGGEAEQFGGFGESSQLDNNPEAEHEQPQEETEENEDAVTPDAETQEEQSVEENEQPETEVQEDDEDSIIKDELKEQLADVIEVHDPIEGDSSQLEEQIEEEVEEESSDSKEETEDAGDEETEEESERRDS